MVHSAVREEHWKAVAELGTKFRAGKKYLLRENGREQLA
jgi:hypothetical protein